MDEGPSDVNAVRLGILDAKRVRFATKRSEVWVNVVTQEISRQDFVAFSTLDPNQQEVPGLGDGAYCDVRTTAIRVLVGTTCIVLQLRRREGVVPESIPRRTDNELVDLLVGLAKRAIARLVA